MGKYIGKNGLKRIFRKTATATSNGMMSAADKAKVDKIVTNGSGTKCLTDDGTYKEMEGGGASIPVATAETLGGVKSGIYLAVDPSGQDLRPGEYFGGYPGNSVSDLNGTFSDWGYYSVSEGAANLPEGEGTTIFGLHCRLISKRSGGVKYIEQVLFAYQKAYFYARYARLDSTGKVTTAGKWVKVATPSADEIGTAYFGRLGVVKGASLYGGSAELPRVKNGIDIDESTGEIALVSSCVKYPLSIAYIGNPNTSGPVDSKAGMLFIDDSDPSAIKRYIITESNGSGTEASYEEIDASEVNAILLNPQGGTYRIIDSDGNAIYIVDKCTSTGRPELTAGEAGVTYFDTDLGKPIWWNGSAWVDAMGNDVDEAASADNILNVVEVQEDGFYLVDEALNIGAVYNDPGLNVAQVTPEFMELVQGADLSYEVLEEI